MMKRTYRSISDIAGLGKEPLSWADALPQDIRFLPPLSMPAAKSGPPPYDSRAWMQCIYCGLTSFCKRTSNFLLLCDLRSPEIAMGSRVQLGPHPKTRAG